MARVWGQGNGQGSGQGLGPGQWLGFRVRAMATV